jgi:hypothetical protein
MTIGRRLILETLTEAQTQLSSYQDKLEDGHNENDPLTRLNDLTDAQAAYQDYLTALKKAFILNVIDPNGAYADFKNQLDSLEDSEIEEGYTFLANGGCGPDYTLDCLTLLFENSQNAITPIINIALKERIIAEARDKVAFDYNGRDVYGNALPINIDNTDIAWDDVSVTARALFEAVPFQYNRVFAANCAINTSRNNFENLFPYGSASLNDCNITGFDVPNGVGSDVTYSFLRHVGANAQQCQQSTGSAVFISESIFRGGELPMFSVSADNFVCGTAADTDWLICKSSPTATNFEATYSWRDHFGIIQYFTGIQPTVVPTLSPQIPIGSPPPSTDGLQSYMYFFRSGENGVWRENLAQDGQNYLYTIFRSGDLALLETGDYIFHYLGANISSHGFIIVGWGDAVEVDVGLNANQENTQPISLVRPRDAITHAPQNSIPYVADFAYGYSDGYVGWLQDPRPRPFYASLAEMSNDPNQLQSIAARLGFAQNFQQGYLGRLQENAYRRFATGEDPNNPQRIPSGWLFFHFPTIRHMPFTQLLIPPILTGC